MASPRSDAVKVEDPMRLGYFAMPLPPPGADPAKTMDDDLAQLATLDRLGYEEAWIGEHFTAQWENIPCPDLFIARTLGMTKKMKLATGVSCRPAHAGAVYRAARPDGARALLLGRRLRRFPGRLRDVR